jgi:predicted RNA-binding protein with PIN domain
VRKVKIIIDGYNLIRRTPALLNIEARGLEAGRDALLDRLFLYKGGRPDDITVVFDGPSSRGYFARGGIRVQFAPSADEAVVALASSGTIVVSSDAEVQAGARRRGAQVQGSDQFWQQVKAAIASRRYRRSTERPRPAFSGTWDKADWDEDDDDRRHQRRKRRRRRR